jgi:hypothetical protein
LAVALASALIAVASALMPARALPQFALSVVDKRRADIVVAGITVTLSIGIGIAVVQVLK